MASQESTAQIGIDANLTKIFLRKSPESLSPAEVEAYRCFICRLLLRQPSQLSCCGRRSCRSCIDGKRRNRKIFHCPKCNEEIGDGGDERNYVFTDASCVNDMKNMETVCNTKPSPCKWRGKVSMLEVSTAEYTVWCL
ncbi:TNF receptor-associated factor 5-like [Dysidea avara]|uniref:TNF receptor-associated factor 5-like n=1 Tax=Dysidea avara TaxID=196820 RepID=UPI003320B3C2